MGRPPEAGTARLAPIQVRMTESEKITLDKKRGEQSRSAYIRDLVAKDKK